MDKGILVEGKNRVCKKMANSGNGRKIPRIPLKTSGEKVTQKPDM